MGRKTHLLLNELRLVLLELLELLESLKGCSCALSLSLLKLRRLRRRRSESRGAFLLLLLKSSSSSVVRHACELAHQRSQIHVPCVYETLLGPRRVGRHESVEDGLKVGFGGWVLRSGEVDGRRGRTS